MSANALRTSGYFDFEIFFDLCFMALFSTSAGMPSNVFSKTDADCSEIRLFLVREFISLFNDSTFFQPARFLSADLQLFSNSFDCLQGIIKFSLQSFVAIDIVQHI